MRLTELNPAYCEPTYCYITDMLNKGLLDNCKCCGKLTEKDLLNKKQVCPDCEIICKRVYKKYIAKE